jgi:hypothetical protein
LITPRSLLERARLRWLAIRHYCYIFAAIAADASILLRHYSYGSSFALPPPRRRRDLLCRQRHYAAIIASTPFRRFIYALIIAIIFRHYIDIFASAIIDIDCHYFIIIDIFITPPLFHAMIRFSFSPFRHDAITPLR